MAAMRQRDLFSGGEPGPARPRGAERPGVRARSVPPPATKPRRTTWTVSELADRMQGSLETEFFDLWVEGEVSGFKAYPGSGHWYFTLKDDKAAVRAVVYRLDQKLTRFVPRDGMVVLARGGLVVYKPKGDVQFRAKLLEPAGQGALQAAFEQLKEKLAQEGLFAAERKRPLPRLPRRIGVVTSPAGAVIRDILNVLRRRYANLEVLLYPARVQGEGAAEEVAAGVRELNRIGGLDVLIVARGGGSLEDLQAFNDEGVARAIAASAVPVISAVGHETDFTIADFVADLRAPTPSAAAELVVQAKAELQAGLHALEGRLRAAVTRRVETLRHRLLRAGAERVFEAERGRLARLETRLGHLDGRARAALTRGLERAGERLRRGDVRLAAFQWERRRAALEERLRAQDRRLATAIAARIERRREVVARQVARLEALSPLKVLSRGYALVFDERSGRLVRQPAEVAAGQRLRIRVEGGELRAAALAAEEEK